MLEAYSPLGVRHGGRLTAVLAGFALILLAQGLWRRKRMAWLATLVVLLVSAVSHLIKGLDYEETLMALGLAVWLVVLRDHFHARSDRPSVQQGLRTLALAFVFTLGYGVLGFYLLDRHYTVNFGFWDALRQTVVMFTQFYDPGLEPVTGFGRYFADSIYIVGFVTFGYALWMLLRPVFVRDPATPEQRLRARPNRRTVRALLAGAAHPARRQGRIFQPRRISHRICGQRSQRRRPGGSNRST